MYKRMSKGWLRILDFILLDMFCLFVSFLVAFFIRHNGQNPFTKEGYMSLMVVLLLFDVVILSIASTFKGVLRRGLYPEFKATLRQTVILELAAMGYVFLTQTGIVYSRLTLFYTGLIYLFLSCIVRSLWKNVRMSLNFFVQSPTSLLMVTTSDMLSQVLLDITEHYANNYKIAGLVVLDEDLAGETIQGVPIVANADEVSAYVCREWVDEVFINLPEGKAYPTSLLKELAEMGVVVHIKVLDALSALRTRQFLERFGDYTVLTSTVNYASPTQLLLKRVLDIVGGVVGCLITIFLILILGPIIYIKSPGSIFFAQTRVGRNGKKFKCYKFRSMHMDAEERKQELMKQNRVKDGRMFKLDFDPRIIGAKKLPDGRIKKGIGNFIRDLSLDEFPQFFNVLKGDMSLVGTRPPTVDEWEQYELHHRARLAIKPGITGLWQVSGRSEITDFEEVVKLDTQYITNWSMGLDFQILLKTVAVVFKKKGAM